MKRPHQVILILVAIFLIGITVLSIRRIQKSLFSNHPVFFAEEVAAFTREDQVNPPPKGGILFIGSSIFREWSQLEEQMAPLPVFNRAFGGSRTWEVLHYMDNIVFPYEPKIIVYYCGSNDINALEKPEDIFQRIKQFSQNVNEKLPETQLYFVSINRAPEKIDKWHLVDTTNMLVKEYCSTTEKCEFIDVNPILFDKENQPRLELYQEDQLHLNDKAYEEFAAIIKPIIEKAWMQE